MEIVNADLHNHFRTRTGEPFNVRYMDRILQSISKNIGRGSLIGLVNMVGREGDDRNFERFSQAISRSGIGVVKRRSGVIYVPNYDIAFVKGFEVATNIGHVLSMGVPDDLKLESSLTWQEIYRRVRDVGGANVIPHPYHFLEGVIKKLIDLGRKEEIGEMLRTSDAWEALNGEAKLFFNPNGDAIEAHKRLKREDYSLGCIGVSDGHSYSEAGVVYTRLGMPKAVSELIDNGSMGPAICEAVRASRVEDIVCQSELVPIIGATKHAIEILIHQIAHKSRQRDLTTI